MDIRRILLIGTLAFLAIEFCFAYTVILKNGKRVDGAFVEEDDSKILVKDKDGIILTFRKETLDLQKMSKLNLAEAEKDAKADQDEKESSKPQTRVFTNEDLKDLPEISVFSPDSLPELPEEEEAQEYSEDPTLEAEAYWKEQTRMFGDRMNDAKENYEHLKEECEQAQETLAWYVLNGYLGNLGIGQDVALICDQANQAKAEVERLEKRLEDFQERARREGALPGWVDPDRIDL